MTVSRSRPRKAVKDTSDTGHDIQKMYVGAQTEEAIRSPAERLAPSELGHGRLLESAGDGILILKAVEGCDRKVEPYLQKRPGFSRDEMIGKSVSKLNPFKDIESNKDMLERLRTDGYIRYEDLPLKTRDGLRSALEFVSNVLGRGNADLILSDFTLPAFDGLPALKLAYAKYPGVPFIFVSGALGEDLSIDSLKSGATDYFLKQSLARLVPAVRIAMQEVEEPAGNRRSEKALQESEQLMRIVFSESVLGIALFGADGHPVLTNPALQKMLGYTDEDLRRMSFLDFTHPDDCAADLDLYEQLLKGARNNYHIEKRYIRKDGQVVWGRLSLTVAHAVNGCADFIIGMVEDITDRRGLELKFIEAQKMEVIGQLAGRVAHDFNNIIAIIMGYSELIVQKRGPDSSIKNDLDAIRHASEQAASLTRQLLDLSRKQSVQPVVLDLNAVVKDLGKMLNRLIDENIEMSIVPEKQIGRIKADSGCVGQLLMNLVVNARDAMPNGGKLTITTRNVTVNTTPSGPRSDAIPGHYVMLNVSDTGMGMSEEVKAHLFEAFFTTKPKGKGTGLGLTTCQTIVQQSGGHLAVASEVGKGTTFKIYFPRVDLPIKTFSSPQQNGPVPHGTETLLVVEAEPSVRNLARGQLETPGYKVISASNGQEAQHVVRGHQEPPIRLAITDVTMLQTGGKVMTEWLKKSYPDLKILFTSRCIDDAMTPHGAHELGFKFLSKPYTLETLPRKIRKMLDAQ